MCAEHSLRSEGYRRTESECHTDDCEGQLWYDSHTLVCDTCHQTTDLDEQRRTFSLRDPAVMHREQSREDRPTYENSGRVRLPGGFPVYDWINSDDVDGTVSDLDPENFYA